MHPDEHYHFDSLIARVQHYLYENGEYDPEAENFFAPALINRIDCNTGRHRYGGKNAETLRIMNQRLRTVRWISLSLRCVRRAEEENGYFNGLS